MSNQLANNRSPLPLRGLLLVFAGGFIGTLLRFGLSLMTAENAQLPVDTLIVNISGSFAIGVLAAAMLEKTSAKRQSLYLFLATGILGGFTTYSAFALEIVLYSELLPTVAIVYSLGSVIFGALAAYIGLRLTRFLMRGAAR